MGRVVRTVWSFISALGTLQWLFTVGPGFIVATLGVLAGLPLWLIFLVALTAVAVAMGLIAAYAHYRLARNVVLVPRERFQQLRGERQMAFLDEIRKAHMAAADNDQTRYDHAITKAIRLHPQATSSNVLDEPMRLFLRASEAHLAGTQTDLGILREAAENLMRAISAL